MAQSNLDFEISAQNRKLTEDVDKMLKFIVEKQEQYGKLSATAKKQCDRFTKTMAVYFVFQSNKVELNQTFEGTLELLKKYGLESKINDSKLSPLDRECVNCYNAICESFFGLSDDKYWSELRESGILTVDVVCNLHTTLLKGLPKFLDGGKLRKKENGRSGEVQTTYGGKIHHYPPPEVVESRIYGIIDEHTIHMECGERETSYIFKCAAWLLFELVTLHPFYDGNGRICRLLANYVLSLITPFPVAIYYDINSSDRNRDHFINAIILGRDDKKKGCGELASMLVEGAYLGWKDLFQYLEEGGLLGSKPKIGPIVVRKSHIDEIKQKVKRFCPKNISSMEEKILADVQSAVESADTSNMTEPDQHIPKHIEYEDIILLIHIYQ